MHACFVLHNYCELNNESINEETVRMTINYDREFQPPTIPNRIVPLVMKQKGNEFGESLPTILTLEPSNFNAFDPPCSPIMHTCLNNDSRL